MIRAGTVALVALLVAAAAWGESAADLERRSKAFYELLEHGDRERAAAAFPDLERALAQTSTSLKAQLDQMREEIGDDGDLAALFRSTRWREAEVAQMVVAYHLAWVRYQGALLPPLAARKAELLKQAVAGFSQFLLLGEVPEIYADCLYGRGLAYMELGDTAKATDDLEEAARDPRTQAKARVALEETKRRARGRQGGSTAPANDPETLLVKLGDLLPRATADAAAEKEATTLARGLAARGGPWPQRVQSTIATKLGDGTPLSVRSSYGLFLLGQLAVDQGRCADVGALTEAGATVQDAGRSRFRPELLFLDGGCRLNAGQAREAADRLGLLVREFPGSAKAPEAAYYRLRALDVARVKDPSLVPLYEEAATAYLTAYPRGPGVGEAHFMLGELYRSRGECSGALKEYAKVASGGQAIRARFGELQCGVASLPTSGANTKTTRAEMLKKLVDFVRDTPTKGADADLVAQAALLGAAVAAGSTPPDHTTALALLEGFEARYPGANEYHARALELRLRARVGAGALDGVAPDLDVYLARATDTEAKRLLRTIGRELATLAGRLGGEGGAAARELALRIYEKLVATGGDNADRLMLAELQLRAGQPRAARTQYEAVLAADPQSTEALRGAAQAAAASKDHDAALAYWKQIVDSSTPGGTGWYEARLAQVTVLAESGRAAQACALIRSSRGRATSSGADVLDGRLRALEPQMCR